MIRPILITFKRTSRFGPRTGDVKVEGRNAWLSSDCAFSRSVEASTGRSMNRSRAAVIAMPAPYTANRGQDGLTGPLHAAFFGVMSALIGYQDVRTAG